jgi:putative phosphoribosyl transferase
VEVDMTGHRRFRDRADAGRMLAEALTRLRGKDVVVLGLPRGGVPVAAEVAGALAAPLDVIVAHKASVPSQPELALGAVGEGGARVLNPDVIEALRIGSRDVHAAVMRAEAEVERRVRSLRGGRAGVHLAGRTVVIVDDGIATGATARAACRVARARGAARVVLAAPVAPRGVVPSLSAVADEVVVLRQPAVFGAVGSSYDDFTPTSEAEVVALLGRTAGNDRSGRDNGAGDRPVPPERVRSRPPDT